MSFARNLATVSSLTMVSRVSGFVRDTLMAMYLGADAMADAAFVAQRLPNLFRSLFAEGAFSAAFVPLYATEQKQKGTPAAQRFAGQAFAILLAILIPFSAVMMICMPWIASVYAIGYEPGSDKFDMVVKYSVITFPYLTLISITALQGGILNAHSRFGAAAAAPISLNLVIASALVIGHQYHWEMGSTVSWAFVLSGIVQLTWLAISCYRARLTLPLVWPKMSGATQKLFRRIGPGAIGAGAAQVNMFMTTMLATILPTGGVASINYADRLNQLPLGIIGIAVATTLLPLLSRFVEEGAEDKVQHYTSRAIEFCLMLGLPSAFAFIIVGEPIIQTLFEHGEFKHDVTIKTAEALAGFAMSIPAFLVVKVLSAGFYARHDTATPVKVAVISIAINIGGALLMLRPYEHIGITAANSVAVWINVILLYVVSRRRKYKIADDKLRKKLPRIVFCVALMIVATYFIERLMRGWFTAHDLYLEITGLGIMIGSVGLFYAILLHVTGAMKWNEIINTLRRRGNSETIAKSDLASPS